jgi:hypothetical protein
LAVRIVSKERDITVIFGEFFKVSVVLSNKASAGGAAGDEAQEGSGGKFHCSPRLHWSFLYTPRWQSD